LKIALVILHADPAKGGAERYTFDLAEALAARGHEVSLVASTFGPRPSGVRCIELAEGGVTRLGRYRRFLDALDGHLSQANYDVVHAMLPLTRCDVYHPHAGLAAEAVATGHLKHSGLLKRSVARVSNQLNPKRNAFARVERELLARSGPIVLCLSEYVKATARKHYRLPDERLATLFNAVDLARFDPAARPEAGDDVRRQFNIASDRIVALMVAQDFERKGLREAIAALAQLAEKRLVLLVVGKPDPRSYRQMARELNVTEQVLFAGATSDPYPFYAAADFFVLPTRHDPCSLVVLEALAMGLPVISTMQNGACEIMTPGEHGFVLESADDREGLIAAMRALCDEAVRTRMRGNCLALRPKLAYGAHLEALLNVYAQVRKHEA
jgi:UDP-glucose:(heptosyl)LPS alpha-1,3-glucosyltransferase